MFRQLANDVSWNCIDLKEQENVWAIISCSVIAKHETIFLKKIRNNKTPGGIL